MCARCSVFTAEEQHDESLHLCSYCAVLTRIEVERGFVQLESYLARWAAFQAWSTLRG